MIALIDEESDLVAMSRASLEHEGFTVVDTPDARSGRAVLRAGPVDLVALDLGLPDGDGLDLLRGVRHTGGPPVITVTGRGEETGRVLGPERGRRRLPGETLLAAATGGPHPAGAAPDDARKRRQGTGRQGRCTGWAT